MEPKQLPRSQRRDGVIPKGHWRRASAGGKLTALVSCPVCGKIASLNDHEIAGDGSVSPSLVCPFACDFHEFVQLKDWDAATNGR